MLFIALERCLLIIGIVLVVLTGCSRGSTEERNEQLLHVDGEHLAFAPTSMTIPGGNVPIVVTNTSTTNQHLWALIHGEEDVAARVVEAVVYDSQSGSVSTHPDMLAHTALLRPRERETVVVSPPSEGLYTYICLVSGHYAAGMKGTLVVQ